MDEFSRHPVARLKEIVARLRAPGGCPWDREQTHASIRAALIEETYETLAAIDARDDANLCEELGDLLLHVVMHSQMAAERGAFDLEAVAAGICEKMIRRHPHVFGDEQASDSAAVLRSWEQIKRQEKGGGKEGKDADGSRMSGLLAGMPALMRAQKAHEKAARVGFDWPTIEGVLAKVREELAEVEAELEADPDALAEELGDLLFAVVNLARWRKLESELLLNRATDKFVRRFQRVEAALHGRGRRWEEAAFEELDAIWEEVKALEAASTAPPNP
jgi:MazG family protein